MRNDEAVVNIPSVIKQGCQISVSSVAIAFDPFIRKMASIFPCPAMHLCAFAADLGQVLWNIGTMFWKPAAEFMRLAGATGMIFNQSKCALILLWTSDLEAVIRYIRRRRLFWDGIKVMRVAKYLGTVMTFWNAGAQVIGGDNSLIAR